MKEKIKQVAKRIRITEKGINFLLIFILGFLVGVAVKAEAQKRITIGFNDYLVPRYKQDVNLMSPANAPNGSASQNQDQVQSGGAPQPTEQNNQ